MTVRMIPDAPHGTHQVIQPTLGDAAHDRCRCVCGFVAVAADCWEARARVREHVAAPEPQDAGS